MMKLSEFDYELPKELIAQVPLAKRDSSKLLIVNKKKGILEDDVFSNLENKLGENDVLVINKTRVINARLKGFLESGKEVEIFLHKQISNNSWDCLVYPGKKLKPGIKVFFDEKNNKLKAEIKEISDKGRIVEFNIGGLDLLEIVEEIGNTPLPPYIKEKLENKERYQTVFNEISGSSAAPTAGLHFTKELITKLENKGVKIEKVLLHVGLGTFLGVETENITDHKMHSEYIELEEKTAKKLNKYKLEGKRIIAVGTTSIRVLESFSDDNGVLSAGNKNTKIFIYPGYKWKFVDSLITNFHLPKSTLLMLVSSLASKEIIKKAYTHAIKNKYRFFSFGDAMWIQ